jgi:hypothetical protein
VIVISDTISAQTNHFLLSDSQCNNNPGALCKFDFFLLTFVFLSTHSSQDRVGLFRFCFFFGGFGREPSSVLTGEVAKVLSVVAGEMDV